MTEGIPKREQNPVEALRENSYAAVDPKITPLEQEAINEVRIERAIRSFDHFGPIDPALVERLRGSFEAMGENTPETLETISTLIVRMTEKTIADFNKEAAWLTVRTSLPTDMWDIPRWHADGAYFTPEAPDDKAHKMVMGVKGAKTRFAEVVDRERFEELSRVQGRVKMGSADDLRIRRELEAVMREVYVDTPAAYYLVGDPEAMIHSEPPMPEPRIFVSVLPGTVAQIEELRKNWDK